MRSSLMVTAGMILLVEEIGIEGIPGRSIGVVQHSVALGCLPRSSEST